MDMGYVASGSVVVVRLVMGDSDCAGSPFDYLVPVIQIGLFRRA